MVCEASRATPFLNGILYDKRSLSNCLRTFNYFNWITSKCAKVKHLDECACVKRTNIFFVSYQISNWTETIWFFENDLFVLIDSIFVEFIQKKTLFHPTVDRSNQFSPNCHEIWVRAICLLVILWPHSNEILFNFVSHLAPSMKEKKKPKPSVDRNNFTKHSTTHSLLYFCFPATHSHRISRTLIHFVLFLAGASVYTLVVDLLWSVNW